MKLTDLSPRWLEHEGQRIGIMFACPHCVRALADQHIWLTCFFVRAGSLPAVHGMDELHEGERGERLIFEQALRELGHPDPVQGAYRDIVDCEPDKEWKYAGADFRYMSISPSIDASASGHWHGFITSGEISFV